MLAELKWEPSINAAEISVEVDNGIVTLADHGWVKLAGGVRSVVDNTTMSY